MTTSASFLGGSGPGATFKPDATQRELADDVRWFAGSPLAAAFGRLALDQVAHREIAAAVDRSGRFADNFTDRGIRSAAFTALATFGDSSDVRTSRADLKRLHRDVRGTGKDSFSDTRYSALDPEVWIWVAVSGLNLLYQAYLRVCGRRLTAAEKEVVYQTLRAELQFLELPSKQAKLPATLHDMLEYYNAVAAKDLSDNDFLQFANRSFVAPPIPKLLLPRRIRPLLRLVWPVMTTLASRPVVVCSAAVAHPTMRGLLGVRWGTREQLEFAVYVAALQLGWRWLPRRLTLEPLAYNRYQYERLRDRYRSVLLDSFAAPGRA
ncbi:oxygenase MpaB family protein [Mycobacterium sp. MUNTM1]